MRLDVLFATQLVGVLTRVRRRRPLITQAGSPAKALSGWLIWHGWTEPGAWSWRHALSGRTLDLNRQGEARAAIRDAWRAWCLCQHMASDRRDADLDCFARGYFGRINWDRTRKFVASGPEARAVRTGANFSPTWWPPS